MQRSRFTGRHRRRGAALALAAATVLAALVVPAMAYDADRDAFEREGIDLVGIDKVFSTVSVMATGRWHEGRVLLQYDHERNPFGRGDGGMPTTRSADRLTVRAQVGF